MIWYQYILLAAGVILYALSQLHQMNKLKWQKHDNQTSFFGWASWVRKYEDYNEYNGPAFLGSTTFLVMFTDFYHASQAAMKVAFSLGIFGITWKALIALDLLDRDSIRVL